MNTIVVVGSLNVDLVTQVARMPLEGETVAGLSFASYAGGKGANQAVAAARLNASVAMIGRVGEDAFGQRLLQELRASGVNTECVLPSREATGTALIMVTMTGANSIVVVPGANAQLTATELLKHRATLTEASVIMSQLEVPLETVELAAEIAEQARIPFLLDPAPARRLPVSLLRRVTWLTPNETEAVELLNGLGHEVDPREESGSIAAKLLAFGVQNVILKLGARGVYLDGKDVTPTYVQGYDVQAVDTTAAGDAFNGGFAVALANGFPIRKAAAFANAVAAISVTRAGAQPSMPNMVEVIALQSK